MDKVYRYPLMSDNFTYLDRLKTCLFLLNKNNRLTQDKYVKKVEEEFCKFIGCNYSVFVSSGSTANSVLSMYVKDKYFSSAKNQVILPSLTWATSCNPWIREGFDPIFLDIKLDDFSLDLNLLDNYLVKNHKKVAVVFITSLLGFAPNLTLIKALMKKYPKVYFALDNCESTFTTYGTNISNGLTSTTSTFFGHEMCSLEGGFVFTNNRDEYLEFLMYRNHGMVRSLNAEDKVKFQNKNVDSRFDFYNLGSNFRNTEINAYLLLLDLERKDFYIQKRCELYSRFHDGVDKSLYHLPDYNHDIPFCLPIICKTRNKRNELQNKLEKCGFETRPIIGSFLGYQSVYQPYFRNNWKYDVSKFIHNNGFYVGLNPKLEYRDIDYLVKLLN